MAKITRSEISKGLRLRLIDRFGGLDEFYEWVLDAMQEAMSPKDRLAWINFVTETIYGKIPSSEKEEAEKLETQRNIEDFLTRKNII